MLTVFSSTYLHGVVSNVAAVFLAFVAYLPLSLQYLHWNVLHGSVLNSPDSPRLIQRRGPGSRARARAACFERSQHVDRRICGMMCSAVVFFFFFMTVKMRLILSSLVQITECTNLPINTPVHFKGAECLHAHVLHSRAQACCVLHMGCTCVVS